MYGLYSLHALETCLSFREHARKAGVAVGLVAGLQDAEAAAYCVCGSFANLDFGVTQTFPDGDEDVGYFVLEQRRRVARELHKDQYCGKTAALIAFACEPLNTQTHLAVDQVFAVCATWSRKTTHAHGCGRHAFGVIAGQHSIEPAAEPDLAVDVHVALEVYHRVHQP